MAMHMSFPASYPRSYREQLLSTVGSIDTARVARAIEWMTAARDAGRSIFVAGNGGSAATAAHFVRDMGTSLGRAMEYANSIGCRTLALAGRDGGKLGALGELNIHVPEPHMGRIEDAHQYNLPHDLLFLHG
ncbi:MAG TPA: SIS domain-containing protein [Bryobacteraceae bacterium]|jgi:phosphoheptose isomerase|nr:SIS domain-containing protein [Bryobacteraceae bacterium]